MLLVARQNYRPFLTFLKYIKLYKINIHRFNFVKYIICPQVYSERYKTWLSHKWYLIFLLLIYGIVWKLLHVMSSRIYPVFPVLPVSLFFLGLIIFRKKYSFHCYLLLNISFIDRISNLYFLFSFCVTYHWTMFLFGYHPLFNMGSS